jgi:DnaJ domain
VARRNTVKRHLASGCTSRYAPEMARRTRTDDWGFPRWREYGSSRDAVKLRLCDRHGCSDPGDRPAPKSPNSPERWWFCERHAAEYNQGWNYFEGLSAEEAAAREADERRDASGFQQSKHYGWGGPGDGSRSRDEMHALSALELDEDADFEAVKLAWRRLAKANHPDVKPGDAEAAVKFQAIQAAYEVLRSAEERRLALG